MGEDNTKSGSAQHTSNKHMHELVFASRDDGIVHEDWAEGIDEDGHYGNAYYRAQYKLFRQCFVGKNEQCHVHKPKHHARWKAESIVEQ